MADATSALVSRFGYLLDDALFDDEQVQAHTLANGLSEEQARRQLVNAWVESGSKVVSAIGSRHGSQWLIDAVEHSRTEEAFALLSLGADPNGTDYTSFMRQEESTPKSPNSETVRPLSRLSYFKT